jgi:hypothetical protein
MKYYLNRGNFCDVPVCSNRARIKGLCANCYQREKIKKQLILKILAKEFWILREEK